MKLLDFYPLKGIYSPGEKVALAAMIAQKDEERTTIAVSIFHLSSKVASLTNEWDLPGGTHTVYIEWEPPMEAPRGYGVEAHLVNTQGQIIDRLETAFDVNPNWANIPRYGFLCDFWPSRADIDATLDFLTRFHINGLQFYDWMFRHDQLLPAEDTYLDPLGRQLSLHCVRNFIHGARSKGMAAMAYAAVYAASVDFWRQHAAWALCDCGGKPIPFGQDFLGLMNPTPGRPWSAYLQNQILRALSDLPFNGIHLDQYGEPKEAYDAEGNLVDLPAAFRALIEVLKQDGIPYVTFNAVGGWPIEVLARSAQDFSYIEVWPPAVSYRQVHNIILKAQALSEGKPVVIALYLPQERVPNILLTDALIFACGASHIELGERGRLLVDPYFPKHQALPADLEGRLRKYYDCAVRYGELFGPSSKDMALRIRVPEGVWPIPRSSPGHITIGLINFSGLDEARWDRPHPWPVCHHNLVVEVDAKAEFRCAWYASPDEDLLTLRKADTEVCDGSVLVQIPSLKNWAFVTFELESEEH